MARKGSKPMKGSKSTIRLEFSIISLSLWVFGLFFLLAWIFALGIFVGRGNLPEGVTSLAGLKGRIDTLNETAGDGRSREMEPATSRDPDPELVFYKKLSTKKEEARHPSENGPRGKGKIDDRAKAPEPAPSSPRIGSGPEPDKPVPPKEAQPPRPRKGFSVQVASLSDKRGALDMIDRLLEKGYDAYFSKANVKGKTYYRVRCGVFPTRDEASRHAATLQKDVGMKGLITRIE